MDITDILTFAGILVAIFIFKLQSWSAQQQIISVAEAQLKVIDEWVGGWGYIDVLSYEEKLDRTRPFYVVLSIEHTSMKNITVQPGIVNFSPRFNDSLAEFNQKIDSIRHVEQFRELLVLSDSKIAFSLEEKIKNELNRVKKLRNAKQYPNLDYGRFIITLSSAERLLADRLYYYNHAIHYKLIGSKYESGLNFHYHILLEELRRSKQNLTDRKVLFYLVGSMVLLLILLLIFCRS